MQSGECSFAKHKLLSKREEEEEKNYFRHRVTLKFYQTGKMFSKFLTNILALEWEIIHLGCYSYSEIIVVKNVNLVTRALRLCERV